MRHVDLFSGIGGFSLAASWVWGEEHEIVCFVEIDKFRSRWCLLENVPGLLTLESGPDVAIVEDESGFA
jgi:site-specific DNA-cytosine methylase